MVALVTAQIVDTIKPNHYEVDASDLRIIPGEMPITLETNLGNGRPLVCKSFDGNLARYQQSAGVVFLNVYND
jgi:hypothetical protein